MNIPLLDTILAQLENVQSTGPGKWQALCPAHDDHHPSLSITQGDNGKPLLYCHGGCTYEQILQALEIQRLNPAALPAGRPTKPDECRSKGKCSPKPLYGSFEEAIQAVCAQIKAEHTGSWTYHRADGQEAFRVARFDRPDGDKQYRPLHNTVEGWVVADPPGFLPLYNLPELKNSGPIYVVEGEKCADAAKSIGLLATTSAHGARVAHKTDWSPLAGREIVLLPDNDEQGRQYANEVARILFELDPTTSIKIVKLPGFKEKGDIADLISINNTCGPDTVRLQIEMLVSGTPFMDISKVVGGAVTICLADVEPEELQWLWPGRIPLGKLTILAGDPGLGKSFLTLDMAARISKGSPWPDNPGQTSRPGDVVLLSAEDDIADTIRPRLDTAGADPSRIIAVEGIRIAGQMGVLHFSLQRDLHALELAISRTSDVKLVVIDPITAYLGHTDSHKNADVRALLAPLAKLAADHDVAVLGVTHLNKALGGKALYRTMGSLAFTAAARAVWLVTTDKDCPDRRLILPAKINLAAGSTGLAYTLLDGAVAWEREPIQMTANEALAAEQEDANGRTERDDACDWLKEALTDGPVPSKELMKQAKENGIAERTLRRAKDSLKVAARRQGFGPGTKWFWELPGDHRWPAVGIDGQPKDVDAYEASGHLCGTEDGGHDQGGV